MLLKNMNGDTVYEDRSYIVSNTLQSAVQENIDLNKLNLRNVKIRNIELVNISLQGSCFWGSIIHGVDFSYSDLSKTDFRNVKFTNCDFTGCDITNTNFLGSQFKKCNFKETDLSATQFSRASILYQNIDDALSLRDAVYLHFGEIKYDLSCFLSSHSEFIQSPKVLSNQFVKSVDSQNAKISSYNS